MPYLVRHAAIWDNWHLLWYLLLAGMALAAGKAKESRLIALLFSLLAGLLLPVLLAFFLTEVGDWVVQGTLVNRVLLHIAPFALLAVLIMLRGATRPEPDGGGSAP